MLGSTGGTTGWIDLGFLPSLTPLQSLALDQKIDDGLPASGTVRAVMFRFNAGFTEMDVLNEDNSAGTGGNVNTPYAARNCVTGANGRYNLSTTTIACLLAVRMQ